MRRLIRSFGIRAEAFASGREFLGSGLVEDTVCLILDVRMPGMDGLELQTLLADNHHRVPVIFVSAYADAEEQRRAMQAGALDFLRKPVRQEATNKRNSGGIAAQPSGRKARRPRKE
jgi:two-component system, LuxR family, response regulator FixJ